MKLQDTKRGRQINSSQSNLRLMLIVRAPEILFLNKI